MNSLIPDYKKYYPIFKAIPTIVTVLHAIVIFIVSIGDAKNKIFFHFDSWLAVLLVWWIIGAISCVFLYFVLCVWLSPTVLRTDAVLSIEEKARTKPSHQKENQFQKDL